MSTYIRIVFVLSLCAPLISWILINLFVISSAGIIKYPIQLLTISVLSAIPGLYVVLLAKITGISTSKSILSYNNVPSSFAVIVCGALSVAFVYFVNISVEHAIVFDLPGASTSVIAFLFLPVWAAAVAIIGALVGAVIGMALRTFIHINDEQNL